MGLFGEIAREGVRCELLPFLDRKIAENRDKSEIINLLEEIREAVIRATEP